MPQQCNDAKRKFKEALSTFQSGRSFKILELINVMPLVDNYFCQIVKCNEYHIYQAMSVSRVVFTELRLHLSI